MMLSEATTCVKKVRAANKLMAKAWEIAETTWETRLRCESENKCLSSALVLHKTSNTRYAHI